MQILVDIPEKDIPKHQEVIDIRLHFIDGHIVDADGYGFAELPKGHGRLVDADKIGLSDFEIIMCDGNYKKALLMLINKIEEAPTIIEADKVEGMRNDEHTGKGKWLEKYTMWGKNKSIDAFVCNKCKAEVPYPTKFCPNCGVDMREGCDTDD